MVQNEEKLIKNTHYVPEENLSDNGNTPLIDLYILRIVTWHGSLECETS
jgi:hypothetical protein